MDEQVPPAVVRAMSPNPRPTRTAAPGSYGRCYLRDKSGRNRAARAALERELAFFCKYLKVFYRTGGYGGLR